VLTHDISYSRKPEHIKEGEEFAIISGEQVETAHQPARWLVPCLL
jgi:hypothetical protein